MGDWAQLAQSVILGLIVSYLLAKLISIVVTIKEDNHEPGSEIKPEVDSRRVESSTVGGEEEYSLVAEQGISRGGEEDDDWEGVESTELDEAFSSATFFASTAAADRLSRKVPSDVQQQLYGLYKIATEGPCTAPQPSALKLTARAKWQAWRKLGAMTPEEAMEKYIEIVTQLYPTWSDSGVKAGSRNDAVSSSGGTMGPVFSSLVYKEESQNDLKIDAIHAFAREGEVENLLKSIESGIPVNAWDSEGRTPLHWAIDRGHLDIAKLLVDKNANVNAKDKEGKTPLHYAVVCDREAIAEFLVKQKANTASKDDDGNSPVDLCESDWPWLRDSAKQTD
ncbi:Acyl-CoA-binding domain-containing protein 2 [Hirschfeldia incana]|nr:Acyl-CoA-binding domain-containing protein 2 [Hirschfeldia incana]